ncbi:MAG: tyrosine-type recombinase/integrase [Opitutaceae bacterium]|jgi:integrase
MRLVGTSVYPRKDSPYWWVKFWCPQKLRFCAKSTNHRRDDPLGYKRAVAIARELSADALAARTIAPSSQWDCWVMPWLQMKHQGHPNTMVSERNRWQWVDAFLTQQKVCGPQGVTYQLGLEYMTWRTSQVKRVSKKHPSHNTALAELRLFARVMREAVHRGFIATSPLERMGIKKQRPAEKPEMTDADVAAIRQALAVKEGHLPLRDRWMTISFEIALFQGCRISETSVPFSDIDLKARRITFHAKGAKVYTTTLHPNLLTLVRQLKDAGAERTCVLPKMVTRDWHLFLKGRLERNRKGVCPHLTFHSTRVTVITRMARDGVPIQQAMAYVGHADQTVHRIYQRLQADDLTRCTQALRFFPANGTPQTPGGDAATPSTSVGS